jgi:aryl-alcohol dehydrogenase-like predicted oxidoreductase
MATAIGAGDLADSSLGVETCAATLRRALDAGVNVVDTAPAYEEGLSERVVSRALEGRRGGILVIDKVDHLDRPVAPQVDASLERLGFSPDVFVFHGVSTRDAWDALFAAGRFNELDTARRRGSCRFVGVSTHHPEVARAAVESGRCDVVMLPVGPFVDESYVALLPVAARLGVGTVGFKAFGAGKLVTATEGYGRPLAAGTTLSAPRLTVDECLHATLTLDPDVALLGLSTPAEQDAAFAAFTRFEPLGAIALDDVRRRAARAIEGTGAVWWNPRS